MSRGLNHRLSVKALRGCAAAALLSLLAACATPSPMQTAAAPDPKNGDGIGGTGVTTAKINTRGGDGIGGTGIRGTITGFGSILVNGLKLEFDNSTKVETDGKPATLEALRVGQIVQGVAHTDKNGKLSLAAVEIQHAVTGPISAIDYNAQTLTVLGQNVRLNLGADKHDLKAFTTLAVGDMVVVSGLRQADGTIVATRVDQRSDEDRIMIRGLVVSTTATTARVGNFDIALPQGSVVKAGERILASGRLVNGVFAPDVVTTAAALPFDGDVSNVSLEAYAPQAGGSAGAINIDGVNVSGAAIPAGTAVNDRVVVTGTVTGPNAVTASNIAKANTVVTINAARGSRNHPAAMRPDNQRPERVAPRPNIERPQTRPETPSTSRPPIERPQGVPMV
jgi:hypothetical protein